MKEYIKWGPAPYLGHCKCSIMVGISSITIRSMRKRIKIQLWCFRKTTPEQSCEVWQLQIHSFLVPDVKSRWEEVARAHRFMWQQSPALNWESPFPRLCSSLGSPISRVVQEKFVDQFLGVLRRYSSIRFDQITSGSPSALTFGQRSHTAAIVSPFMGEY